MKMNWLKFEQRLRVILGESLANDDVNKTVVLIDECLAAYTRRGNEIPEGVANEYDPEDSRDLEWELAER